MRDCVKPSYIQLLIASCLWAAYVNSEKNSLESHLTESSKNNIEEPLYCHVCHSESDSSCFSLMDHIGEEEFWGFNTMCSKDEKWCMVRKFAYTATNQNGTIPKRTFAMKRNCTSKCEDGCVVMGERTKLYVCTQCCRQNLCNTGSGSNSFHPPNLRYILGKLRALDPKINFYLWQPILRLLLFSPPVITGIMLLRHAQYNRIG